MNEEIANRKGRSRWEEVGKKERVVMMVKKTTLKKQKLNNCRERNNVKREERVFTTPLPKGLNFVIFLNIFTLGKTYIQ
jgi:hypothetical protein